MRYYIQYIGQILDYIYLIVAYLTMLSLAHTGRVFIE
jgi:hypothetical protein